MAITEARHVESAAGSGAASIVATCQRMEESRGIRRRKWSRIVGIIAVCQGVMEPRGIRRRKWSRIVAVAASRQGVQTCRLKFGWSVWRREVVSYPFERSPESGSCGSSDGVFLQPKLGMRSGSHESPDGVFP